MKRSIESYSLCVLCCLFTVLVGCFPEDSLEWSGDETWGLLRIQEKLCVVDGTSGAMTPIKLDRRFVASLMPMPQNDDKATLVVTATNGETDAIEVATGVALGCDWPDEAVPGASQATDR